MGMFDTFSGWVKCSTCNKLNAADIQFKWHECMLDTYSVGDYIEGYEPFTIFDRDEMKCEHCATSFTAHVIGKLGYVHGFCNEKELPKLKERYALKNDDTFIHFVVSKEMLEIDFDKAIEKIREGYQKDSHQEHHVITNIEENTEDDQYICRIPSLVKDPNHRLDIGDTCYYDNRTERYENWDFRDELATIIEREFDDVTHLYLYSVKMPSGEIIKKIHETKLVNEEERKSKIKRIQEAKKDILSYWEAVNSKSPANEDRRYDFFKMTSLLHYQKLVQQMIENGELPPEFTLKK